MRTFGNLRHQQTLDEQILLLVLPFQPPALGKVEQQWVWGIQRGKNKNTQPSGSLKDTISWEEVR